MKYIQIVLALLFSVGVISSQEAFATEVTAKANKSGFVVLDTSKTVTSHSFNVPGMGAMKIIGVRNLSDPNKTCVVSVESLTQLVLAAKKKKGDNPNKPGTIKVKLKAVMLDLNGDGISRLICLGAGKDCVVTIER